MNPGVANRAGFRVQKTTAIYHDYGGFWQMTLILIETR